MAGSQIGVMVSLIAVLMTCHNRRDLTLRCLESLFHQDLSHEFHLDIYLVDDASTDGTGDEVRARFPSVNVVQGNGSLYWTGGMLLAEKSALTTRPDYLLWLNDDVALKRDALSCLLDASRMFADTAIVVGSTVDSRSGQTSYGGLVCTRMNRPFKSVVLTPNGQFQNADMMNGNIVLVPRALRERLGPLDELLPHNGADYDYGLRAKSQGVSIVVAPFTLGFCDLNGDARWRDKTLSLRKRWISITDTTCFPPKPWLRFARRYGGRWWLRYFLGPYIRCVTPVMWK